MQKITHLVFPFLCLWAVFFTACSNDDEPWKEKLIAEISVVSPDLTAEMQFVFSDEFQPQSFSNIIRNCEIYDPFNDRYWNYIAIVPLNYSEDKSYPFLYLLHGKDSSSSHWFNSIGLKKTLDYFFSKGLQEMIVILPDGENTYYVDDYQGDIKYETFFQEVFMPEVEKEFRFCGDPSQRWIGGFSMGGYGALYHTLKYPGKFSFCYAMSTPTDGKGDVRTPSPISFIDTQHLELIPSLHFDIGNNDGFLEVNLEAHLALDLLSIPHEIIVREGAHNASFWKESVFILLDRLFNK